MCLAGFGYRIGERAVEILFLGIRVRSIPFSDIGEVSLGSRGAIGEVWTVFKFWGLVTITKREGFKYVTLAPRKPQLFVAEIRAKILEADGRN